ncbi:MAG: phosphoenolpyruvate--protein phosphotransferase [Nannocystaceae bacterium]|nr:phosphoenolpyruvate--protein phosphotransferase [Nannocystaceae bacterium]
MNRRVERDGGGRTLRGIAVSSGIAIGPAYVVDRRKQHIETRDIERAETDEEVARFEAALAETQAQLRVIEGRLPHGEHRQILRAQQLMLEDPDLAGRVSEIVREELIGAECALARVADEIREMLAQADDQHFRERSTDITLLAERVLVNLLGHEPQALRPPAGAVVIAHDLSPADTAEMVRSDIVGIVTAVGGITGHSAIIARSMELPAVVGVDDVDLVVERGDTVVLDAIHGVVLLRPSEAQLDEWNEARRRYDEFEDEVQREHGLPAMTRCGQRVTLRANVALTEEVASSRFHGAEGVGLYRTEFLYMGRDSAPSEEEHYRHAKDVLRQMAPYPVVFRTFDLGSDKQTELLNYDPDAEANPAMGVRGLRLALANRDWFLSQIRGLLRAALHGPLRIMLPMVTSLPELKLALEVVKQARQQLEDDRLAYAQDVPVGIMVEVPSAALEAERLARYVDFMSIGTNDLIQYTLAIDRENDDVAYLYRPLQSAILQLIQRVSEAARAAGIPVSLCGELAADPRYTWVLLGLGVTELSMHPSAIPVIKNIIRSSDYDDMVSLVSEVLELEDVDDAERLVLGKMRARFPEHLDHGGGQRLATEDVTAQEAQE